ncbi:hypothetical protein QQX98_003695 [Neonectria punicea]|uniref:Uncharacterized protein n=1 Tax=Neonectria punicea TaxID=979145 RepID=A0ABR1HD93_9HYPO
MPADAPKAEGPQEDGPKAPEAGPKAPGGGPNAPDGDDAISRVRARLKATKFIQLANSKSQAKQWIKDHPYQATAFGAGATVVVAPALVATPALAALGFGANGIVGGSIAAGVQSGIGSVVAPSLFATLQSAGAAGYGLAAVHGTVQGVALGAGGLGAWFSRKMANREGRGGEASDKGGDGPGTDKPGPDEPAPGEPDPGDPGPDESSSDDEAPEKESEDGGAKEDAGSLDSKGKP